MPVKNTVLLSPARRFIEEAKLPPVPKKIAVAGKEVPRLEITEKAIAVGSQLMEFNKKIKANIKTTITDSMLFAQLVANKSAKKSGGDMGWYEFYVDALSRLGWVVTDMKFTEHPVKNQNLELHKAIIPVITAMLGPQAAAAAIILAVLNGLSEMNKDRPWLTLFERESKRFDSRQFQVSYADVDGQGNPQMSLLCFILNATQKVTQILFFKFADSSAILRKTDTTLVISAQSLESVKKQLAEKLLPYRKSYIENMEL